MELHGFKFNSLIFVLEYKLDFQKFYYKFQRLLCVLGKFYCKWANTGYLCPPIYPTAITANPIPNLFDNVVDLKRFLLTKNKIKFWVGKKSSKISEMTLNLLQLTVL